MGYKFGSHSKGEMRLMQPDLIRVFDRAIEVSEQDFGIFDGIRTAPEQNALFKRGASQVDGYEKLSKHQVQPSGFCEAGDLVPWINGQWDWDWPAIYVIADAVVWAAKKEDVPLRWGGCWGYVAVNDMSGSPENWVAAYVKRKRSAGKRAFNDGPHWEILRK